MRLHSRLLLMVNSRDQVVTVMRSAATNSEETIHYPAEGNLLEKGSALLEARISATITLKSDLRETGVYRLFNKPNYESTSGHLANARAHSGYSRGRY